MAGAPVLAAAVMWAAPVEVMRTPGAGLQPQAVVDSRGAVHLIYYQGEAGAGDIYYVRRDPGAAVFSAPVRVNSLPGSAIAAGTIRGAQLVLGRNGRVHVAWNGSRRAEPKAPGGSEPMLYTRMNASGTGFEPQRNLIQSASGLDGGGAIAASPDGRVYVFWHAPPPGVQGEENRRVWVARSQDDGGTFDRETPVWDEPVGACGCCGMRAFADADGVVYAMFRSALRREDRDMHLLVSTDGGQAFRGHFVQGWKVNACPMSSESIAPAPGGILLAWETRQQVWFTSYDRASGRLSEPVAAPGSGKRKHPVVARNGRGQVLLAWAEGTGFNRGGALMWQVMDASGRPIGQTGEAPGLPASSLAAAIVLPGGGFLLIY